MLKNRNYHFYFIFFVLVGAISLIYGCAAMKSPEGGPRDTTPPKVLKMTPENLTTNFTAKKIIIEFDEYIKLSNEFKEFSISPELEKVPELRAKLKRLEINLSDSLEKNTTYTLNFGKSIVDLNEGNVLKNFSYAFATGPTIDSLSLSGNVTNALTGEAEIESTVFILPLSRDSLFGKKRAPIFTLTDSSGNFKLNNLKKDTYKVYALKEKGGGDRIYQQISDEIGFIKDPIVLDKNIDSLRLSVFKEIAPNFRVNDRKLNADGSIFMSFNKKLNNPDLTVIFPPSVDQDKLFQFNKTKDSVSLWLADLSFDSVKVAIKDEGKTLDTVKFSRSKRDTYNRVVNASDNLESGTLNPNKDLTISFNFPIKSIDESKIILLEDSIPRKFTLEKDSTNFLKYHIKYKWRAKEDYILLIRENAVNAIFEAKNKELIKKFTLGDANEYGSLVLQVETPDSAKSYILEIVNKDNQIIASFPVTKKSLVKLSNYKQGVYYGRIVYDENKNGIWDTGNVKLGTQPEAIWYYPKELSIRANWDRNETITIPLVAPIPVPKIKEKPINDNNTTRPAPSNNNQPTGNVGGFRRM
ncbi:Ig-like domain-containing domain [Pedobacter sp. SL55]|uniref:Ig-like domain-containing domain n=1 Tax=Pedobacter sp. SL55 TaxID=2995161 RepID=UPI002271DB57|nr:Ig-like domain-containing domain [Pedobacter sp. SL55]WAC41797.1 Ig-like domain-containing domain [Pedobacter sp. SL55]